MKYSYCYKTSDGVRHEAEIDASSREEVFETLRGRGIRPIKVLAADGSKANGELHGVRKRVVVATAALAVLLTAAFFFFRGIRVSNAHAERDLKLKELVASVEAPVERFGAECKVLFPGMVSETQRSSIVKAKNLLDEARRELSAAYARALDEVRDEESRRYLEAVRKMRAAELERARISLSNRRFAVVLLEDNSGKWHLEAGRVVFDDANLQRMFDYCCAGMRQ